MQTPHSQQDRRSYEASFFDEAVTDFEDLEDYDLSPDALDRIDEASAGMGLPPGDFKGWRVLDCGCGNGVVSVYLAEKGARVDSIDLSEESLKLTAKRAQKHGRSDSVSTAIMSAEALEFPDETFDMVCGRFILHHLDLEQAGRELYRVLKPGGKGIFFENSANNVLLMAARKLLSGRFGIQKFSDDIEHPLRRSDVAILSRVFGGRCTTQYPFFVCMQLLDHNIFRKRFEWVTNAAAWFDGAVFRFAPFLRRYGYFQYVLLEKPEAPAP